MNRTHQESWLPDSWVSSCGRYSSDDPKITGMTPAWFTFNGKYVEVPPYIRRPIIRLAYCTGIRRWACSMNTTVAKTATANAHTTPNTSGPCWLKMLTPSAGTRDAIEVKISSDMPLPIRRSVISSPMQLSSAAPAVVVTTVAVGVEAPSGGKGETVQPGNSCPRTASATMPVACSTDSAIVRYRVY